MSISELIECLQERLQRHGDIEIVVHDTLYGELCGITFDSQIALQRSADGNEPVLAFSPSGDWSRSNHYSA